MGRVQCFTACTPDGFIAHQDNSLDWLFEAPHGPDDSAWDEFISGVEPMVMGVHRPRPARYPGVDLHVDSGGVRPVYDDLVATCPDSNVWLAGGRPGRASSTTPALLDVARQN